MVSSGKWIKNVAEETSSRDRILFPFWTPESEMAAEHLCKGITELGSGEKSDCSLG